MKKLRLFLDADVILDLLTEREPHYRSAVALFLMIQKQEVKAYTSPVVIANIFYILCKNTDRMKAIQALLKLKTLVKVLDCGNEEIELALASDFNDFEDAIQYYTALSQEMDVLLTRNGKDYKGARLLIQSPAEFVGQYPNAK